MKSFKQFNEVAPPGFGHTKGDKEKDVKKGGTAAAFKRALDRGDFKGLPGDKTYKDKKASMFKLMWSMKKKGDKPHYKPGTDKKYKKYQEESIGFTIDSGEHKKASKKAKIRNLARGNENPAEKAAAEKKAGGPKLIGEEECKCEDCGQDPCIECGESHHNIEEGVRGAAIGAAVGGVVAGPLGAAAGAALGASSGTGKKRVAAYNKGRKVVQSIKDKARKIKQTVKGSQEKRREAVKSTMAKEEKMTPMQDNNLFGNAYAGSKRQKKKAIDAIPNKSSEVYNRNWQHKTPDNARESVEIHDAKGNLYATVIDIIKPEPMKVPDSPIKWKELTETKLPSRNGNIIDCYLAWRGNNYMIKMFFPQSRTRKPTKSEVNTQLQKVYPGAKLWNYQISNYEPGAPLLQVD